MLFGGGRSNKHSVVSIRKHVLLTGLPGIGKTTLVEKACEQLNKSNVPISGFYTKELRNEQHERVGFDVVCLDGKRSPLARIHAAGRGPQLGKYTVDLASFEATVLPVLSSENEARVCVIDEIGKMELFSSRFKKKVTDVFHDHKCVVLGTVPVKKGHGIPFVESLKSRTDVHVLEVSLQNRDRLLDELTQIILHNFKVAE